MSESKEKNSIFLGTYFERDSVLRLARIADVFAWIALALSAAQVLISLTVLGLQLARGMISLGGFTDFAQQIVWLVQPLVPGMWYFVGLQAVGRLLLIFMDIEDNTRHAARK